jgi:hypothetical protein
MDIARCGDKKGFNHHNVGEQPLMIEIFQSLISMAIETF